MDELTKMLDKLVEQKTFGLDALDAISKLRDKAIELEHKNKATEESLQEKRTEIGQLNARISTQGVEIKQWQDREKALADREKQMTALEKEVAVERAKASTLDSCFARLFANRTVRENVQHSVPVVVPPSYPGGNHTVQHQTDSTKNDREEG